MRITFLLALSLCAIAGRAQDTQKVTATVDTSRISKINDDDKTYTKVEIESAYPGGQPAWTRFLNKTMHYPDDAVNNEIQGTVIIQFIVEKDGSINNIEAISGPKKGGLREEGVRVIRLSGKWVPAVQNGRAVKSYKKQPLVFKLSISK
jgi:protein TonB